MMLMSAYNEDICILVEELLGVNLETLRKKYGKLSYATVSSIGIQLVIHSSINNISDKQIGKFAFLWIHP